MPSIYEYKVVSLSRRIMPILIILCYSVSEITVLMCFLSVAKRSGEPTLPPTIKKDFKCPSYWHLNVSHLERIGHSNNSV